MPVYNEADGLKATLLDLWRKLPNDSHLIIVDDNSKDRSREIAEDFSAENRCSMTIIQNQENKGHGPSIVRGLFAALESMKEDVFILTLDGDGQIPSVELHKLIMLLETMNSDVIVGIRKIRRDAPYRKVISLFARVNLFFMTGIRSRDANTPIRIWKSEALHKLLLQMPSDAPLVPNITLTKLIANNSLRVREVEIEQHLRNGDTSIGVSWSNKWSFLPSKRLIKFAARAFMEQWKTK